MEKPAPLSPAQRARVRRLASPVESDPSEAGGELNVVPFLDIVMNVLLFVLATIPAVFTAAITTEPPSPPSTVIRPNIPPPTLQLTMMVTDEGVALKTALGSIGAGCELGGGVTVSGREDALDWGQVKACARKLKEASPAFASEQQVTLMASNGVDYATVVRAMDAVREDSQGPLFPEVQFGVPR